MRSNYLKFKKNKRKNFYRNPYSGIEEVIINILAILVIIFIFVYIKNNYFEEHQQKINVPVENIAAFKIPYKTLKTIEELSSKYNIDFYELLTIYSLEEDFYADTTVTPTISELEQNIVMNYETLKKKFGTDKIKPYKTLIENIFTEIKYFPIPEGYTDDSGSSFMYGDSFGSARNYGGERIHLGTDILDRENIRGRIKIVSMTDGTVENIGWNELGGFRVGIRTINGNYYYYAHLDSFATGLKQNDTIKAGDIIGFMGDTGYSKKEGTTGNFPVHLHIGINPKTTIKKDEFWINPYPFLRYVEDKKISLG